MKPKIVFMGSPEFAVPSLQRLIEKYDVIGVVTQPDRPAGRGKKMESPPVKKVALDHNIPVMQPPRLKTEEQKEQLFHWNPDLIIVAAFGQILRRDILDLPEFGCINVHASLLPRWRGAAPIQAAILNGDSKTGVTIMKMDPGIDTGPILTQKEIMIGEKETAEGLSEQLSFLGANLLIDTLPDYLSGNLAPKEQSSEESTYAPMLKKEDGHLDFTRPAEYLERMVRAFYDWPAAYFKVNDTPIKVLEAEVLKNLNLKPAERGVYRKLPVIGTGKDALQLKIVQPAGKKPMDGKTFLNGFRDW